MDIKTAMRIVIDYLDEMMVETPSRELADTSNYLEKLIEDIK